MERANIIQARHDEETTSLAKRQVGHGLSAYAIQIGDYSCTKSCSPAGLAGVLKDFVQLLRDCSSDRWRSTGSA